MRGWAKLIVVGFAWALCFSALAGDRAGLHALGRGCAGPGIPQASRPLDDERLDAMRAGLAAPAQLQQAGVILWDEPRKVLPPLRNGNHSGSGPSVNVTVTIHR